MFSYFKSFKIILSWYKKTKHDRASGGNRTLISRLEVWHTNRCTTLAELGRIKRVLPTETLNWSWLKSELTRHNWRSFTFRNLEDGAGFEPTASWLTVNCSTTELSILLWPGMDSNHGPSHYECVALTNWATWPNIICHRHRLVNTQIQPNVPDTLLTKCADLCFLYAASDLLSCLCFRSYRRQHTILLLADRSSENRDRTDDLWFMNPMLLPTELPRQIKSYCYYMSIYIKYSIKIKTLTLWK
jgi:hypothetical protein